MNPPTYTDYACHIFITLFYVDIPLTNYEIKANILYYHYYYFQMINNQVHKSVNTSNIHASMYSFIHAYMTYVQLQTNHHKYSTQPFTFFFMGSTQPFTYIHTYIHNHKLILTQKLQTHKNAYLPSNIKIFNSKVFIP